MLGAIFRKLLLRGGIPNSLRRAFRKAKSGFGGCALQLLGLVEILKITIVSLLAVFICIDGLDECLPKNLMEVRTMRREIRRRTDSDTLMAARSQPNDNWGSVGNGAKHGEKHVGGGSGM